MHYRRWRRHGDPQIVLVRRGRTPIECFTKRYVVTPTGCWEWTGDRNRYGYGSFVIARRRMYAHRWSYEHFTGPIPKGLTIEHRCHAWDESCAGGWTCLHRRCVNPSHLEPLTLRENVLRSPLTLASINLAKTACPAGHPYDSFGSKGERQCSLCRNAYYRRKKADQRAAAKAAAPQRLCRWCNRPIPLTVRSDAVFCQPSCHRKGWRRTVIPQR